MFWRVIMGSMVITRNATDDLTKTIYSFFLVEEERAVVLIKIEQATREQRQNRWKYRTVYQLNQDLEAAIPAEVAEEINQHFKGRGVFKSYKVTRLGRT